MTKREPNLELLLRGDVLALSSLDHASQRQAMLEALHDVFGERYGQRDSADPGIALIEALAAALDVLGFYHDRFLTESKLGSAVRIQSVARLAEAVGHVPTPRLAARALQFFEARAEAILPRETRVSGKRPDGAGNVVFETTRSLSIGPAFNRMPMSPLVTQHAGASRVVIARTTKPADSTLAKLVAIDKDFDTVFDRLNLATEIGQPTPRDDFQPGFLAMVNGLFGLELATVEESRSGAIALQRGLRASYDADTTFLHAATQVRHLRMWRPLGPWPLPSPGQEQEDDGVLPRAEEGPELVVFELAERPILHYPDANVPGGLRSSLEVYVFEGLDDPGPPSSWSREDAWTEVPDFSASEASDRHYRTFVDDRLHIYLMLRRRLGYRVLLSDEALCRVFVRYTPAIGTVEPIPESDGFRKPSACNGRPVEVAPGLEAGRDGCDESPVFKLDEEYFKSGMVCPALKQGNETTEVDCEDRLQTWAVTAEPLGLRTKDQILIKNTETDAIFIRTLTTERGRHVSWVEPEGERGRNTPTAPLLVGRGPVARDEQERRPEIVPHEQYDPLGAGFTVKKTEIMPLRAAASGQKYVLWDEFYNRVEVLEPESSEAEDPEATDLRTIVPKGSIFLFLADTSQVKPGDFVLIGARPETPSDPKAPWLTAEVVQAQEVHGRVVRLRYPTAGEYRGVQTRSSGPRHAETGQRVLAVPQVASVYYGDRFKQSVPLDPDRQPISANNCRVMELASGIPSRRGINPKRLQALYGWNSIPSSEAFESLFLAVADQALKLSEAAVHWSMRVTVVNLVRRHVSQFVNKSGDPADVTATGGEGADYSHVLKMDRLWRSIEGKDSSNLVLYATLHDAWSLQKRVFEEVLDYLWLWLPPRDPMLPLQVGDELILEGELDGPVDTDLKRSSYRIGDPGSSPEAVIALAVRWTKRVKTSGAVRTYDQFHLVKPGRGATNDEEFLLTVKGAPLNARDHVYAMKANGEKWAELLVTSGRAVKEEDDRHVYSLVQADDAIRGDLREVVSLVWRQPGKWSRSDGTLIVESVLGPSGETDYLLRFSGDSRPRSGVRYDWLTLAGVARRRAIQEVRPDGEYGVEDPGPGFRVTRVEAVGVRWETRCDSKEQVTEDEHFHLEQSPGEISLTVKSGELGNDDEIELRYDDGKQSAATVIGKKKTPPDSPRHTYLLALESDAFHRQGDRLSLEDVGAIVLRRVRIRNACKIRLRFSMSALSTPLKEYLRDKRVREVERELGAASSQGLAADLGTLSRALQEPPGAVPGREVIDALARLRHELKGASSDEARAVLEGWRVALQTELGRLGTKEALSPWVLTFAESDTPAKPGKAGGPISLASSTLIYSMCDDVGQNVELDFDSARIGPLLGRYQDRYPGNADVPGVEPGPLQPPVLIHVNKKAELCEAAYKNGRFPADPGKPDRNFLTSSEPSIQALLVNVGSACFPRELEEGDISILICASRRLPRNEGELEDTTFAVVSSLGVYSQSIVFNSGNFIPVINAQTEPNPIESALHLNVGGQPLEFKADLEKFRAQLEKAELAEEQYAYNFNKTPEGVFTINVLFCKFGKKPKQLEVEVEVEYAATRAENAERGEVYEFETDVLPWDPRRELVLVDSGNLKHGDYLFLHTGVPDEAERDEAERDEAARDEAARDEAERRERLPILWTRVQEIHGRCVSVWPPLGHFQPREARRYSLHGLAKVPRPQKLDPEYYKLLSESVLDVDDEPFSIQESPVRLGDQLPLDPLVNTRRLESLIPGDRLLIWDERWRKAWQNFREDAQAPEGEKWFDWPDYQHEAVVKSVDAAIGLVVLEEPLPARFQAAFVHRFAGGSQEGTPPDGYQHLRVLPYHRAPFQGARVLVPIGSGNHVKKFPRYLTEMDRKVGLASVPLDVEGTLASNVEVLARDPRSGDWSRWTQFQTLETAKGGDAAFTLGVEQLEARDRARFADRQSGPVALSVSFGDGRKGALLPTGEDNVYIRTTRVERWNEHLQVRRGLRVLACKGKNVPFATPETGARQSNLWLLVEFGGHAHWRPTNDSSRPWRPSMTVQLMIHGREVTFREITREEALAGHDGIWVSSYRPGVVQVFFFSQKDLFALLIEETLEVKVWAEPQSRVWSPDRGFYEEVADPERVPGSESSARIALLETRGLRPGSLLAFDREDDHEPEIATVAEVQHETYSARLEEPLEHAYPIEKSSLRGNLVHVLEGEREKMHIGSGDGKTANLRIPLSLRKPVVYSLDESSTDPLPGVAILVDGVTWKPLDELSEAGPRDRVYRLDRDPAGGLTVEFGDGHHGAIPPRGTDNIEAVVRFGVDQPANVDARVIDKLRDGNLAVAATWNLLAAAGGHLAETPSEVRDRLRQRGLPSSRAITAEDVARLALEVGEVIHARVDPTADPTGSGRLVRVVVALDRRRTPNPTILGEVHRSLLPRLPVTAGARLEVVGAEQRPVHIVVRDIAVESGYDEGDVLARLNEAFAPDDEGFFAPQRWSIGRALRLGDLYEAIFAVRGVSSARVCWMSAEMPPAGDSWPPVAESVEAGPRGVIRCDDRPDEPRRGRAPGTTDTKTKKAGGKGAAEPGEERGSLRFELGGGRP